MKISEYLMTFRDQYGNGLPDENGNKSIFAFADRIECADGFSFSAQATKAAYCSPRKNIGPWGAVEVGFPSAEPEFIMEYAENKDDPTRTVYAYVPVELVEKLIAAHGGMKDAK